MIENFYYVTNRDGTTYNGFIPFENDPDYAEAPDWIDGDDIDCGNALHVVSDNPCEVFTLITRNHPVAHEVEPIDLKPQRAGKFRCRALKRIRTLSDEEFIELFLLNRHYYNKANLACENGWLTALLKCISAGIMPTSAGANSSIYRNHADCLNECIKAGAMPTPYGANRACAFGALDLLNRCIEMGILPSLTGANGACSKGYLACLNKCIEVGVLPDEWGASMAAKNGHLECLNRCIEVKILPNYIGASMACENNHLDCLNACIKSKILPLSWGASAAAQNGHLDIVDRCIEVGIYPDKK